MAMPCRLLLLEDMRRSCRYCWSGQPCEHSACILRLSIQAAQVFMKLTFYTTSLTMPVFTISVAIMVHFV
ncbi:hypothetical protein BDW62DRAFT_194140 [Aspergillus aurantiobrunneus]